MRWVETLFYSSRKHIDSCRQNLDTKPAGQLQNSMPLVGLALPHDKK